MKIKMKVGEMVAYFSADLKDISYDDLGAIIRTAASAFEFSIDDFIEHLASDVIEEAIADAIEEYKTELEFRRVLENDKDRLQEAIDEDTIW